MNIEIINSVFICKLEREEIEELLNGLGSASHESQEISITLNRNLIDEFKKALSKATNDD